MPAPALFCLPQAPGVAGGGGLCPASRPGPWSQKAGLGPSVGDAPEEVVMDVAPPAPDSARAVLPNNILVLSDDTRNSSISDFVEEGSCQPPDLPAAPTQPQAPVCGPRRSSMWPGRADPRAPDTLGATRKAEGEPAAKAVEGGDQLCCRQALHSPVLPGGPAWAGWGRTPGSRGWQWGGRGDTAVSRAALPLRDGSVVSESEEMQGSGWRFCEPGLLLPGPSSWLRASGCNVCSHSGPQSA